MAFRFAQQQHDIARFFKRQSGMNRNIRKQADAADIWRWLHRAGAVGFVIKRDVAGNDRICKRGTGGGNAFDRADDLAHHIRIFRVAEIEAIGNGERFRAHGGKVAPGFGDRLHAAQFRIRLAIARRHVAGHGEAFLAAMNTDDSGIPTRLFERCRSSPDCHIAPRSSASRRGRGRPKA